MVGCLVLWNTSCDPRAGKPAGKNINIMAHGKMKLIGCSKKDHRNMRKEMYGCIINSTKLDFLSDGTPKYARVRVVVFKSGLIFICFLVFYFGRQKQMPNKGLCEKKHSSFLEHQEPRLHIKEDQIILWPLGPFEVMHTKLRVTKTHASGHTLIIVGSGRIHPSPDTLLFRRNGTGQYAGFCSHRLGKKQEKDQNQN